MDPTNVPARFEVRSSHNRDWIFDWGCEPPI